jgi:NAD(P)-dependent dehydrogenase (short-subunit alcohol dehydrogenase family)
MSDLEGQRALVTGAAGGLGSAVSARLKSLGVDVVGLDRVAGVDVRVDVSSATEVRAAIAPLFEGTPLQIVVHCAATTVMTSFEDTSPADWERVMAVNAGGTFNLLQATVPRLRTSGYGRVVLIASIAADFGYRFPAYSASKAAVVALAKSVAVEYAGHGVTVNVVSPGRILTPMAPASSASELAERVPVGRAATPEEVAASVCALVHPDMGYVTGANIICDGGMSAVFALHGLGPYSSSSIR